MKHLDRCPEQEMLSLLSSAQLTLVIDRQMAALHNEQVAYFSQKGCIGPDDPSVLGKEHRNVVLSRFILVSFFLCVCLLFFSQQGFLSGPVPHASELCTQSRPHR